MRNSLGVKFKEPQIIFLNPFGKHIPDNTKAYISLSEVARFSSLFRGLQTQWRKGIRYTESQENSCINELQDSNSLLVTKLFLNSLGFEGAELSGHGKGCFLGTFLSKKSDAVIVW